MNENLWQHRSGVWLPRGSVVHETLSPEELALREAGAGSRRPGPAPARPQLHRDSLDAMASWFSMHGLNAMGVVTFSNDYAARYGIYTPRAAVRDVFRGLINEVPLRGSRGFWGRFALAPEWHRTGREVPHVHIAFETIGNPVTLCADLNRFFGNTRGRSRFEVMRDCDAATLYGLKDVFKEQLESGTLNARLARSRRRR